MFSVIKSELSQLGFIFYNLRPVVRSKFFLFRQKLDYMPLVLMLHTYLKDTWLVGLDVSVCSGVSLGVEPYGT